MHWLAEIRDARLYRAGFDTFEAYCREKRAFTKTYANNLIEGATVVKQLPSKITTIVVNEGQARELAKVEPAKRVEVLKEAILTGDALLEVKGIVGYGGFRRWCAGNLKTSQGTVTRYIALSVECKHVGKLSITGLGLRRARQCADQADAVLMSFIVTFQGVSFRLVSGKCFL
jgi:hypothetical protein